MRLMHLPPILMSVMIMIVLRYPLLQVLLQPPAIPGYLAKFQCSAKLRTKVNHKQHHKQQFHTKICVLSVFPNRIKLMKIPDSQLNTRHPPNLPNILLLCKFLIDVDN